MATVDPINLVIPLVMIWHRIRQCKALDAKDKPVVLETWQSDFGMLMDMRTTLQSDQKHLHGHQCELVLQICANITSYADANLQACMLKLDEEVKTCEAASEADPFPGTLAACTSEPIGKKRAATLFEKHAAASGTEHLYTTFDRVQNIREMVDAMQGHPLLQGRTESQSEILTELCSRMDTAKAKADKLEILVLTLLSMVALWRSLKPMDGGRPTVAAAALTSLKERSSRQSKGAEDTEVHKVPEPLVSLLVQASQGGKAYMSV